MSHDHVFTADGLDLFKALGWTAFKVERFFLLQVETVALQVSEGVVCDWISTAIYLTGNYRCINGKAY